MADDDDKEDDSKEGAIKAQQQRLGALFQRQLALPLEEGGTRTMGRVLLAAASLRALLRLRWLPSDWPGPSLSRGRLWMRPRLQVWRLGASLRLRRCRQQAATR